VRYEEDYAAENPGWHAEDAPDKVHDVLRSLRRVNLHPASVCDIGCGVGEVLARLHRGLGLQHAVGYDISQYAITRARERSPGLTFRLGAPTVDDEVFDVMLMLDVVEHVGDPVAFLIAVKDKAPVAVLNIPLELCALKVLSQASLARGRRALGHVHYFNEHLVRELLDEAAYSIRDTWFSPPGTAQHVGHRTRRLLRTGQRGATRVSPGLAARTIGGSSLMVVAGTQPDSA